MEVEIQRFGAVFLTVVLVGLCALMESWTLKHRCIFGRKLTEISKEIFQTTEVGLSAGKDPKHTSRLLKDYFAKMKVSVLEWPSQSPNLNPIEHLWNAMEKKMSGRRLPCVDELKASLAEKWRKLSPQLLINRNFLNIILWNAPLQKCAQGIYL